MDRDPNGRDADGLIRGVPKDVDTEETLDASGRASSRADVSPARRGGAGEGRLRPGMLLLGRFRVVRLLGEGGMGAVYEAEDLELRESIALKTILPEVVQEPESRERFRREVQLARRVTHRNVCRLFDLFVVSEGQTNFEFLTMELLRGKTLASVIEATGSMSPDVALPVVLDMVAGLEAAHRAGVIHRDFKTPNVFIERENSENAQRAVITDFGLARSLFAGPGVSSITGSDRVVGSPAYMAPEQVLGKAPTERSDVYSLGVVLFEMVTGRRPFIADSALAVALERLQNDPPRPSAIRPGLPAAWDSTILKCLQRDPDERFENVRAVGVALTSGATESTARLSPPTARQTEGSERSRRRRLEALFAALVLVAAWAGWSVRAKYRERAAPHPPSKNVVTIGIAPFNPLSSEARGEAETMGQLVYRSVADLIGDRSGIQVVTIDAPQPPRTLSEARALGQSRGATVLVWGTAAVLQGEVSIEPHVTQVVERQRWFEPLSMQAGDVEPLHVTESTSRPLSLRVSKAGDVTDAVVSFIAPELPALVSIDSALLILSKVDSPEGLFYRAHFTLRKLGEAKGPETARTELEAGLLRWPDSALLHLGLGRVYLSGCRGDAPRASCDRMAGRTHLEKALSLDPGLYDAAEALARLAVDRGSPAKGAAILEAFLTQSGARTPAATRLSKLASLCEWNGREEAARVALGRISPQARLNDPWDPLIEHGIYESFANLPLDLSDTRDDGRNTAILRANIGLGRDARASDVVKALEGGYPRTPSWWRRAAAWTRTLAGASTQSDDLIASTGIEYPLGREDWGGFEVARWLSRAELFSGDYAETRQIIRSTASPGGGFSMDFFLEKQLIAWIERDWQTVLRHSTNRSMGERGYVDETEILAYLASVRTGKTPDPTGLVAIRSRMPALAREEEVFVDVLRGVTSENDALNAVTGGRVWSCRRRWVARMGFYLGALHLVRGDVAAAKPLLERSVETNLRDDWPYRLAQLELRGISQNP